ncbi:hypothetical protein RFH42_11100 [Acinetobacter rudis]|uniref:hypothetical protein n=1 Tax=Acinetobacter rudis TaxID=632955 RepID=UPI00280D2C3C|nr:hypothetical protein [Acinetobacter rudis]MDQ8953507.1 hypothetical protein [Acinetobacter rudis]
MKANEFVKKVGWVKVEDLLRRLVRLGVSDDMKFTLINNIWSRSSDGFTWVELKRLVESHEIVQKLGGLDGAKKKLNSLCIFRWITPEITALEQAIADVEGCQ